MLSYNSWVWIVQLSRMKEILLKPMLKKLFEYEDDSAWRRWRRCSLDGGEGSIFLMDVKAVFAWWRWWRGCWGWGRGSRGWRIRGRVDEDEAAESKAEGEAAEAKDEDEAAEAKAEGEERALYHVLDEDEACLNGEANSSNCLLTRISVLETFEL